MSAALADRLEIWGFENDTTIFSDGSMGFGLKCRPVDCQSWSIEQRNQYAERVREFLNGLPEKIDVQFVQEIVPQNENVLEEHQSLVRENSSVELKELTDRRIHYLRDQIRNGMLPEHRKNSPEPVYLDL